jgi:ABC-type nitrate/sulfonate/bicarbonate transport system substrate-binding protein
MTTRRTLLAGAAAGAAIAGFPAIIRQARAAEPVTLITPFGFDSDFIDMMNAYSGGHLAHQGLDAKVLGATGTVQSIQAVITGEAQFGRFSGIDFIRAVGAKNAPLRAVATLRQKSGFRIVSLPEKPIKSGTDLKGKTIGLLSVGGTTQTFIEVLLAKNGIDKSEAKLIVAGNSPGEVELIHQGRLDCFICTFTVAFTLQQMGEKLEYFDVDIPVPAPGQVLHATRDTLTQKPELVRKVLRAMKASSEEIITQPIGPILERAGKDFDIPGMKNIANLVALEKTLIADSWYGEGKENFLRNVPRRWQDGCDALHSVGFVDVKDPSALYTNEFLDTL